MQLLCAGLNGFGLTNHNTSFVLVGSWSFGVRNAGLRVLDVDLVLLRRSAGLSCLNTGYVLLKRNAGTSVWPRKPLDLLVEL